jgi:glycine/D-amino acid oxidase-like deaminating enzyme
LHSFVLSHLLLLLLLLLQENAWAGLRPGRTPLRLDSETVRGVPVVHCYGHGGSGITLAMGCAEDVVALHVAPLLGLDAPRASAAAAGSQGSTKRYVEPFSPKSRL